MTEYKLDLSPLDKAIAQLDKYYAMATSQEAKANADTAEAFRMAAIQAFEFTYELSYKMLKRFLEMTEASPEGIDDSTFQGLIRLASERGLLLSDLPAWMEYRKQRGTTSHAYDSDKALLVFEAIPAFAREARFLRDKLKERVATL